MDIQEQLTELNAGIADLVDAANNDEISAILAELLEVLKSYKPQEQVAPVVNVTVSPTPINNVINIQRGGWDHTFSYDANDRITKARSVPIQPKAN